MSYSDASNSAKTMKHQMTAINPTNWRPRRLIAFEYYDGPTEGIVDLGSDVGAYCFKVMAMDVERELRVLKLKHLSSDRFDAIVTMISVSLGPPKWPIWVPLWEFTTDEARLDAESTIDGMCSSGTTITAVLCNDTLQTCFSARGLDETTASGLLDWLSFVEGRSAVLSDE
jgi:hypothetical protein